jgi:putative N6-adenine-specific DNA methylase
LTLTRKKVEDCIQFEQLPFSEAAASLAGERSGVMVTNPPYGERLGELPEAEALYREIGAVFRQVEESLNKELSY